MVFCDVMRHGAFLVPKWLKLRSLYSEKTKCQKKLKLHYHYTKFRFYLTRLRFFYYFLFCLDFLHFHTDAVRYFDECMENDPQMSSAVAAIHTLIEYLKLSEGKLMPCDQETKVLFNLVLSHHIAGLEGLNLLCLLCLINFEQ